MSDSNYYTSLQRINRFLFRDNEYGYAFAVADNQYLISEIDSYLAQQAEIKAKKLAFFDISKNSDFTFTYLLENLSKQADGIIVNNLAIKIKSKNHDKNFLLSLNFAREFLNNLKKPVLFWVSPEILSLIFNAASDLYSQRRLSAVFFDKEPLAKIPQQELEERFNESFRSTDEYEKICLRIKLLQQQIDEVKNTDLSKRKIALQIAVPLAKLYSEIDLHNSAFSLLEEYKEYFPENDVKLYFDLGEIYSKAIKYDEAIEFYLLSIELFKKNIEQNPENEDSKYDMAVCYERLGDIHEALGKFDKALEFFELRCELGKQLYEANPKSESLKNGLAISYEKLGDIYQALGQFDKALEFFELETDLFEQLYEANPKSESLKNGLAISYSKLGDIHQALGQFDKALEFFELRCELGKQLYEANPKSESLKNGLAISYEKLGDIHQALGQFDKALEFFELDINLTKQLYEANPKSIELKNGLAISFYKLGNIYNSKKDNRSKDYFNQAINLWEQLYNYTNLKTYKNNIEHIKKLRIQTE